MIRSPYDPMQVYRNRDYACHMMSNAMFDALNTCKLDSSTVILAASGCLDAIESIPAGSMKGTVTRDGREVLITPRYIQRNDLEITPEQRANRDALVKQIIDEILAEER
jgi:hypothetical protein